MARELAAKKAYSFVLDKGLWVNLADAGLAPDLENSINQLQELFQKKYVGQPQYEFSEIPGMWDGAVNVSAAAWMAMAALWEKQKPRRKRHLWCW